jgi:hypothetical protein
LERGEDPHGPQHCQSSWHRDLQPDRDRGAGRDLPARLPPGPALPGRYHLASGPLRRPEERGAGLLHAPGDGVLEFIQPPVQRRQVFGLVTFTHEPLVWPADGGEPDPIEHPGDDIA